MASAAKFVYEIQAQYTGDESIRRLQSDLNALGKVEGYKKAVDQWKELVAKFREGREKIRELRAAMDQDPGNAALARNLQQAERAQTALSESLRRQHEAVNRARTGMEQYGMSAQRAAQHLQRLRQATQAQGSVAAARNLLGTRSDRDIQAEIRNLQRAYETLRRSGTASLSELARAQLNMRARIRQLTSDTNGWTAATGRLQAGFAAVAMGVGLLRLGRAGLDSLTQYDDAMRRVAAISGATAEEFAALDAQAQKLASTTRFSAGEVAAAMQQLAAAGQTVEQIQGSIQAAMDIASIAGMDVGLAADQLTNIMTQFGIEAKYSSTVADALVAGFTGAATTMDQLALAMTYAGPVAKSLGMSLEDTTAVLMGLANAGLKADRAGTTLRGGLTRLIKPMRAGREVLEKYNIQIFDSAGKMREFTDILEDIGRAGMTPTEMIKVFGQEAGPGMIALLDQGADAIRRYRQQIDEAGGKARKLADEMEDGIGGAQRRLQAAVDAMLRNFAEAAEPMIKPIIENLAELAARIANLSPEAKRAALTIATLVAPVVALGGAMRVLQLAQFASQMRGMLTAINGVAASMGAASAAATTFGASVAAAGTVTMYGFVLALVLTTAALVEAVRAYKSWQEAEEEAARAAERVVESEKNVAAKLKRISEESGVTVSSFEALRKALDEGRLHYDEATRKWVAGARQQQVAVEQVAQATEQATKKRVKLEGDALREMADAYKHYVDEVRRLQDEITGRQKSLTAELRDMARSGMSAPDAWNDQKRAAEEYVAEAKRLAAEAKKAWQEGDTITAGQKWKEAVQYADDAKAAYRALNTEVKNGDQVIVSKAKALETAMAGVKEAGELSIDILRQEQQVSAEAMRSMEEDFDLEGIQSKLSEAEKAWVETFRKMRESSKDAADEVYKVWQNAAGFWTNTDDAFSAGFSRGAREFRAEWDGAYAQFEREGRDAAREVERAIDQATKARTVRVNVQTVQSRRWGGLIHDFGERVMAYARGGKLPGYGGGDRVHAMLEPGEFVVRKEAVMRFGTGFFDALNHLRLPDLSALLPQPAAAAPGRTVHINLTLPSGDTYQMQTDPATAARIEHEQERWWALRSSNKVRRSGFARTR